MYKVLWPIFLLGFFLVSCGDDAKDREIRQLRQQVQQLSPPSSKRGAETHATLRVSVKDDDTDCNLELAQNNDLSGYQSVQRMISDEEAQFLEKKTKFESLSKADFGEQPSELLPLPTGEVKFSKAIFTPQAVLGWQHQCEYKTDYKFDDSAFVGQYSGSWSYVVASIMTDLNGENFGWAPAGSVSYGVEVDVLTYCPSFLGNDLCRLVHQGILAVAEDERKLRLAGDWLLPVFVAGLNSNGKTRVVQMLPDFWRASNQDLATLKMKVTVTDQLGADGPAYLYDNELKREGWFMRRWLAMGEGEKAKDQLVVYRFWLYQLAKRLNMPVGDWLQSLVPEIKATTTIDQAWYLSQLGVK